MEKISVFDIIGPNMIGPSSSHTAGALRIARIARQIAGTGLRRVNFVLYGSFAKTYRGHGTDRALLSGMLGMETEDIRIREAFAHAAAAGLEYSFTIGEDNPAYHPNTVEIIAYGNEGENHVLGASLGGGMVLLSRINGIDVHFTGEYNTILIHQQDAPGVIAHIGKCMADYGINIAFMRVHREHKGEAAYTMVETDQEIDDRVLESLRRSPRVLAARSIRV